MSTALATTRHRIDGMDCAACGTKVANAVRRVPGVSDVSVSVAAGTMTVSHEAASDLDAAVVRQVGGLGGYRAAPLSPAAGAVVRDGGELRPAPLWLNAKARLAAACACAFALAWVVARLMPSAAAPLYAAAVLVGLVPIARRALASARMGTPFTIEPLMSVAAIGALAIGAAEEAAAVVVLFLVGELLEGVAAGRARASIRGLAALVPSTAMVERGGAVEAVPADGLAIGDVILVRPATGSRPTGRSSRARARSTRRL